MLKMFKKLKQLNQLNNIINVSNNIVFFGGAGVSTDSGIPDFRSNISSGTALISTKILSRSFFMDNTEEFYKFYRERMCHNNAKPNSAHIALSKLSRTGKLSSIITQNIDGLHSYYGEENVIELHGSVEDNYCMDCNKYYDLEYVLEPKPVIPHCEHCGGIIKPAVVLYEEHLDNDVVADAINKIKSADTLIIGGTSLVVTPAASLIKQFTGKYMVIINKEPTQFDTYADLVINDSIGKVLSKVIK